MSAEMFGYVMWGLIAFYVIASITIGVWTSRAMTRLIKADKDCRFTFVCFL